MSYFKPTVREISLILILSACATILSGFFPNETTVYHPTTMGCELGCEVAGTGYPFVFIADKPYLSSVNSVDWIGALLGVDQLYPVWLMIDFIIFAILSFAMFYGLWRLSERFNRGSGHRILGLISHIFNALLIVVMVNLAFVAMGVVTGMIFMPYYWVVLLLSIVFFMRRVFKSVREMPDIESTISLNPEPESSPRPTFTRRLGMAALFVLAILIVLPALWLRGGLFQEPLATAIATIRLELSGNDWIVDDKSSRSIVKTDAFDMYLTHLEIDGWKHVDQMGSGYLFERKGEKIMLVCRQYSTRYRICSGGPDVINQLPSLSTK